MRILILGGGQTGGTLAEHLANESFDVTVVDTDGERLAELKDKFDIQTVQGYASRPDILRAAGAGDADMLIAVTASDEVNMVACQVSYSLFQTPTKIARIRSAEYTENPGGEQNGDIRFFSRDHMPIDVLINPEQLVTNQITQLLRHPGALQVLDFADGRIQLVAIRAFHGGLLVGRELREMRDDMPNVDTKVVAIFRRGAAITPQDDTVVEADDEVFFIAPREHINAVVAELREREQPFQRIMVAGGGNIGYQLARATEDQFRVRVIETDPRRADWLAERLRRCLVILGNGTDRDLLVEEEIENVDAFCAVTNDDEVNIMSALLAKRLGVRQVMSLIAKPAYVDLVQGGEINIAISPQLSTVGSILTHVRRADVTRVHSLRRGAAEAMEAIVHGDQRNSKVIGRRSADIPLPEGVSIGAIARGEEVMIDHENTVIEADDHIILFLFDKSRIRQVERLFQVGLSFF